MTVQLYMINLYCFIIVTVLYLTMEGNIFKQMKLEVSSSLSIEELKSKDFTLTFNRTKILENGYLTTDISIPDFIDLFGIRPVGLVAKAKPLILLSHKNIKRQGFKFTFDMDRVTYGKEGYKLKFDEHKVFLVHPKHYIELMQCFRVIPYETLRTFYELAIARYERNEEHELINDVYTAITGIESQLMRVAFLLMLDDETFARIQDEESIRRPAIEFMFGRIQVSNLDGWDHYYENQQLVESIVNYTDTMQDYKSVPGPLMYLELILCAEDEPIIQDSLPSKAELEREWQELKSQQNNKGGIPCKRDKKKNKMVYHKSHNDNGNLKHPHYHFWNPDPLKRKLNITRETVKRMRFIKKFVRKPRIFWNKNIQGYLQLPEYNVTPVNLNDALQMFANFDPEITKNEDDFAVGSMTYLYKPRKEIMPSYSRDDPLVNMNIAWEEQLKKHYSKNPHHPEFWSDDEQMDIKSTIECLFDLLASGMRISENANEAFYKIQTWIFKYVEGKAEVNKKFQKLNPDGVLFFLSVISDRGLSTQDCKVVHPRLRNAPLTSDEEKVDLLQLYNAENSFQRTQKATYEFLRLPKVVDYLNETKYHMELVDRELVKYRIKAGHDFDKMDIRSIIAYVYQWSWPKVEGTMDEYCLCANGIQCPNHSDAEFMDIRDDVLMRKVVGDIPLFQDAQVVHEQIVEIKMSPNNEERFKKVFEVKEKIEDKNFISRTVTKVKNSIARSFGKISNKVMEPIAAPISAAADQAVELLNKMNGMIEEIYNKIKDFFSGLTGLPLPKMENISLIISLILDYLIFVNVENVLLKGAVIMSALSKLGITSLFENASEFVKNYIKEETKDITVEPTSSDDDIEEQVTFWTKFVGWVTDINPINAGILVTILVGGLVGYSNFGGKKQIVEFGDKVIKSMRSMSFVGLGMMGMGKIISYVASIFKISADWLKGKFGLLTEEQKQNEEIKDLTKKLVEWGLGIDLAYSSVGLEGIKYDRNVLQNSKDLCKAYFYYYSQSIVNNWSKDIKDIITSRKKKVFDLLNFIKKLDSSTSFRPVPFHVQFYGKAGVGKSTMLEELIKKMHGKYFSNIDLNKFIYSPNTQKDHWDGYWGQICIVVDEMWKILDAETLTEWLTIISCMPLLLPMAALEEKITYFVGRLIFSNTNVIYPRANGVACMDAVWRRRHLFVEVLCDENVMDKTEGKFSLKLFEEHYKGKNPKEFPHLKFNLLKPVLDNDGQYYEGDVALPEGITFPTMGFNFDRLIELMFSRYDAVMREAEVDGKNYDFSKDYDEMFAMIQDVLTTFDKDANSLNPKRNFVTSNVCTLEEPTNVVLEEVKKEPEAIKISNPQVEITETIEDLREKLKKVITDDQMSKKFMFRTEEGNFVYDFEKNVVTSDGKSWTMSDVDLLRFRNQSNMPKDVFEKFKSKAEGTSHECNKEVKECIPSKMSLVEMNSLGMNLGEYLEHCKNCRIGKYTFEDYVDFCNGLGYTSQNQSLQRKRDELLAIGKKYDAYKISLQLILDDTKVRDSVDFHYFIGSIELSEGKDVKNYENYEECEVQLRPGFERIMIDKVEVNENFKSEQEFKMTDVVSDDSLIGMFSEWDMLFLSDDEKRMFNTQKDRINISYAFLRHLRYNKKNNTWFLYWSKTLSWYAYICRSSLNQKMKSMYGYDVTYLMAMDWFWLSYKTFMALNDTQKRYLFQKQGIRMRLYQLYKRTKYYACKTLSSLYENTLGKFFGTIKYVWNKYYWLFKTLGIIGSVYATVFLIRNLGSLFGGPEPTSKILFKKAVIRSPLTGTASDNEANFVTGIRKNILEIKINQVNANAVGVWDHMIMCNKHFIQNVMETNPDYFVCELRPTAVSLEWVKYVCETKNIFIIPDSDVALVYSPELPVFKKILHKFKKEADYEKQDIEQLSLYYNLDGIVRIQEFPFVEIAPFVSYDNKGYRVRNTNAIHYRGRPDKGSSGGILYSPSNYFKEYILGIQCWRDNSLGYGNIVTQEMLISAIENFKDKIIEHEGPYECIEGTSQAEHLIVSHVDPIGIVPKEHVLGTVCKSIFIETPISESFPSKRIPAILDAYDERVPNGTHPLQHSINKAGRDIMTPLNPNILKHCVENVSTYFINELRGKKLKLLSFKETLEGFSDDGNVSMNSKTSPGIPWVYERTLPGKKDYLRFDDEGKIEFCAEEVFEQFTEFEGKLKKGIVPRASMYEFPKDELRPIEKALGPPIKTRSITVLNFVMNLVWRKYFLSLESALHNMADGTKEYCIGINPESMSWSRIYQCLKSVGDKGVDLDVGNWDGHYTAQLQQAATQVTNNIYKSKGIKGDRVRNALCDHNVFGSIQFLNMVLRKNRGLPSGCAGTGHQNTVGHILLIFYIFCELWYEQFKTIPTWEQFQFYVCKRLYGDDIVMSIHSSIIAWFNGKTISEKYSLYGWPTTSAKKTDNPQFLLPIEELTFLKREFVYHPKYDLMMGALDKSVIEDLCHWQRRNMNNQQQFRENIELALEYSWYHGRRYFEYLKSRIDKALWSRSLPLTYATYYQTEHEILARFIDCETFRSKIFKKKIVLPEALIQKEFVIPTFVRKCSSSLERLGKKKKKEKEI